MSTTRTEPGSALAVGGWGERPGRAVQGALLLASGALLLLEVSLTRLFSFTVWYHFAYLTISMALLGFGASGAIVAAFPAVLRRRGSDLLAWATLAAAACTIGALVGLARFPLDVAQLHTAPVRFSGSLLVYYVAIGLPFLLAGFAVSVPFAAYPQRMGRLYFWDLLGAACGCMLAVGLVEPLGVPGLILTAAGLLLAASALLAMREARRGPTAALWLAAALVILFAAPLGDAIPIQVTSTKKPPGTNDASDLGASFHKWTALNRVDAGEWEQPTSLFFWRLNGLGPGYQGPFPKVGKVTYDGCNGSDIFSFSGDFEEYGMLQHHLLGAPYVTLEKPNVLVIGVGGGIDMINAIAQGARHVTGAELQPQTVFLLKERLRDFTGAFYHRSDVTLVPSEGRHFVRKTDEKFDLIQITAVDTFAAQATGAYVLAESYLYTTDAIRDYFDRLTGDGMVSLVIGDIIFEGTPPPLGTRLALIAREALEEMGFAAPADHIMVVARKSTRLSLSQNILVKKRPFTRQEVEKVVEFARRNGFKVSHAPVQQGPRRPIMTKLLRAGGAERKAALEQAWFRMDPVSDRDPFFYNVGKWRHFAGDKSVYFMLPGSFVGQLVLLLMLVQATVIGCALILLPLFRGAREGLKVRGVASYLAYFLALGVGFMFIEISFVQSFVLFLGSPTHALSITLFSLLLFSSLGSFLSSRFIDRPEWALRRLGVAVVLVVVLYAAGLEKIFDAFLHLSFPIRILIAVAAQLPMGLTLGMFMPIGVTCISRRHSRLVPWAWGINGIGSVIGTTLAVVLAMAWGFPTVSLCAATLYAIGVTLMLRVQRASGEVDCV